MGVRILAAILTVLVLNGIECQSPPKIDGSFIAWGEVVQPVEDNFTVQISFEESYDAKTKDAAFFLWFGGKNVTFITTQTPNQTFMYIETDEKKIDCSETSETEWIESDFEASLLSFEDDEGKVKFSLRQLFSLPENLSSEEDRNVSTVYRGIPAYSWTYEYKSKDNKSGNDTLLVITSYWAAGTVDTSAGKFMAPLGFNLSKIYWSTPLVVENYILNVYGFVPNAYDHKYFKAVEGVVCPTRQQTLKFPNVKELRAMSVHTEIALPDYQELRYCDTWFDPVNKLLRVDIERMRDEDPMERKFKKYQSEVFLGKQGIAYRYGYYKGESSCEVVPFDEYVSDMQNLFDVKQPKWNIGKFFGVNETTYTYIGKTTKNDIPCHVFQGMRQDWPDKASGVTSLWEWCFNVNMSKGNDIMMFQDDEFGVISAQIKIISAKEKIFNNYRLNFHFYEVKEQDPKILSASSFDIGKCFSDLQKRALQFSLNVSLDHSTKLLAENATSDVNFLQKWKSALYRHSQIQDYSLRISDVRSTIEGDKMFIKFNILDIHKDLSSEVKRDMVPSNDAEKNLIDSIDAGNVSITHEWKKGELMTFGGVKGSLEYQFDPNVEPQTVPPIVLPTSTQSTLFPFTLLTDKPLKRIQRFTGNQPGAVAGVSIAMLLVGITIGSSATFYKFNGLPAFFRR